MQYITSGSSKSKKENNYVTCGNSKSKKANIIILETIKYVIDQVITLSSIEHVLLTQLPAC